VSRECLHLTAIGYEVLVDVSNFGVRPVECRLRIVFEETLVDLIPILLQPGAVEILVVSGETEQGGVIGATLDFPEQKESRQKADVFETDNTAYAVLPPKPLQKILFYGNEDFLLSKVLESLQNVELHVIGKIPETVPKNNLLVIHRTIPLVLPKGNILIVDPQNDCNLFR
jgi:hypothetical protein